MKKQILKQEKQQQWMIQLHQDCFMMMVIYILEQVRTLAVENIM